VAVHTYEALFLIDPNKASADVEGVAQQVNGMLVKNGGEILHTRPWGEMKLAYPIQKFKKGFYLLTYFTMDAQKLDSVAYDCRVSELILRNMIIKLHPRVATDILDHYTGVHEHVEEPVAT
jgi:small subunit ribosomal protein S6